MPRCKKTQRKIDFQAFMKYRKRYRGILNWFARHKSTGFINKYYHKSYIWSNKIAYLAGLVDGEGYLKIEKHGTIRLIIGMTNRKTIYWIYKNFGGTFRKQKTAQNKDFYVWRMNQGKDLFYLLFLLLPFLQNKRIVLKEALKKLIDKYSKLEQTLRFTKVGGHNALHF